MVERVIDVLSEIAGDLVVVVSPSQVNLRLLSPVRVVEDSIPKRGPVGGLLTGLESVQDQYAWVVGCDMPFLDASLLKNLVSLGGRYDTVVPLLDGIPQTLHSIYAQTCVPVLRDLLSQERPGLRDLLATLNVRYVDKPELGELERWRWSCFNINTPEDLACAERWLA